MFSTPLLCALLCGLAAVDAYAPRLPPASPDATTARVDSSPSSRRSFLARLPPALALLPVLASPPAALAEDDDSGTFEKLRSQAAKLQEVAEMEQDASSKAEASLAERRRAASGDDRTLFNFTLAVSGENVPLRELVPESSKAVLVVNIKQDDPVARKDIAELIALGAKFSDSLTIISIPTDQGFYEPDTSELIRLKLAKEYGYGINPACKLSDKINILGTGADPMMRWIQGTARTPSGLGKIQANFEKFLVNGSTGVPLRRYPRKYDPSDIANDIAALVAGRDKLPPAGSNFLERWREAEREAVDGTYRFQKGLNVFDQ